MAWGRSVPSTPVDPSGAPHAFVPVSEMDEREIKAALAGRSFRQFDPSKDARPRESVIVEFFDGVGLWAQVLGARARPGRMGDCLQRPSDRTGGRRPDRHEPPASPRSERRFPAAAGTALDHREFPLRSRMCSTPTESDSVWTTCSAARPRRSRSSGPGPVSRKTSTTTDSCWRAARTHGPRVQGASNGRCSL